MEYEGFVPLMKKSLGWEGLKKDVVDQGICSACGACGAFCDRIEVDENGAKLAKDCTLTAGSIQCSDNGTCYDNCPMVSHSRNEMDAATFGSARSDPVLGVYKKIVGAKAKDPKILERAQDGGAVTALLQCAMDLGAMKGASVAQRGEDWKTSADVAEAKDALAKAAGTKYARTTTTTTFGKQFRKYRQLALVGTGCQIEGARRIHLNLLKDAFEKTKESSSPLNSLLIGLFCYENFPQSKIKEKLESAFGIKMEDVAKTDITKGKVIVTKKSGEKVSQPVKALGDIMPEACRLCTDFTATFADVSVGSVGTPDGWSTVIARSDKGLELLEAAEKGGYLQILDQADLETIKKTNASKDAKREAARQKRKEQGLAIPSYA